MIGLLKVTISIEGIVRSINSLKEKYRLVLTLYLLEGYDHQEISDSFTHYRKYI